MGTEDRISDPSKKVPPSDKVTPFVTFPGNEIKDLFVHDQQPEPAPPAVAAPVPVASKPPPAPSHPATKAAEPPKQHNQQPKLPPHEKHADKVNSSAQQAKTHIPERTTGRGDGPKAKSGNDHRHDNRGKDKTEIETGRTHSNQSYEKDRRTYDKAPNSAPTSAGTGEHLLKSKEQRPSGAPESSKTDVKGEFDFAANLKTFNKEAVLAEVASTSQLPQEVTKYVKDDFFDTFTTDKIAGTSRMTFAEEKKLNQDTFGISSLRNGGSYRGRGRGNYGGRGYRGRGRSNYKSDGNFAGPK